MIRFRCPRCDKTLKVPEEYAGTPVCCPRCKGRYTAPARASAPAAGLPRSDGESPEAEGAVRHATSSRDEARALFSRMRRWEQAAVAAVAGLGVLGLLLPVVAPLLPGGGALAAGATPWAMVLVPSSLILLLVMLHGRATGCPACGRWWARAKGGTEFVGREEFDKGGVPFARATYRTAFACRSCGHRWSADHTDEYKVIIRDKRPRRWRLR
jgi:hypothetical protein